MKTSSCKNHCTILNVQYRLNKVAKRVEMHSKGFPNRFLTQVPDKILYINERSTSIYSMFWSLTPWWNTNCLCKNYYRKNRFSIQTQVQTISYVNNRINIFYSGYHYQSCFSRVRYLRIITERFGQNRWQLKYWNKTSVIEGCWAMAILLYSRLVQYMSTVV